MSHSRHCRVASIGSAGPVSSNSTQHILRHNQSSRAIALYSYYRAQLRTRALPLHLLLQERGFILAPFLLAIFAAQVYLRLQVAVSAYEATVLYSPSLSVVPYL